MTPDNFAWVEFGVAAESERLEIDIAGQWSDTEDMVLSCAYVDADTTSKWSIFDWWVFLPAGTELGNVPKTRANLMLSNDLDLNGADAILGLTISYAHDRLG